MRLHKKRSIVARRRAGAELLELGLVLGVILLPVMFGTIEFGTYFYVEHNLQAAAREAARAACVLPQDEWPDAAQAAVDRVRQNSSLNDFETLELEMVTESVVENGITYVAVTVQTTWDQVPQGLRPMLLIRNAENRTLKGYAAMRWEWRPHQ